MKDRLYKWQKECLEAWRANGCRGIVSAVTGSGKTFLALSAAYDLLELHPDLRIRIVAPTIALANQWRQAVVRSTYFRSERPGFYGDGIRDDSDCRIMIYVINSARNSLAGHIRTDFALGRHVLLICDECHRYKSRENYKIFDFLNRHGDSDLRGYTDDTAAGELTNARSIPTRDSSVTTYFCLGLSATPFNGDRDDRLTRVLGREIFRYGFDKAVSDETIAPYTICQVAADFLPDEMQKYRELSDAISLAYARLLKGRPYLKELPEGAFLREVGKLAEAAGMDPGDPAALFLLLSYQRRDVSVMAETRIRCCMKLLESLKDRGRIIIFSERIEQAEAIYRQITRKYGNIAGIYHSGMIRDARERVLKDYKENRTRILVSCKCLDEGIDVPDASIGIVLSASAVSRQRIQRLGRIIRKSPDKDYASLYYIYVREAKDDMAYLRGVDTGKVYDLRYYSSEDVFANDLYEYAAAELLGRTRQSLSLDPHLSTPVDRSQPDILLQEIRMCILEGLILPDYLQDTHVLNKRIRNARNTHEKNYYLTMRKLSESFK